MHAALCGVVCVCFLKSWHSPGPAAYTLPSTFGASHLNGDGERDAPFSTATAAASGNRSSGLGGGGGGSARASSPSSSSSSSTSPSGGGSAASIAMHVWGGANQGRTMQGKGYDAIHHIPQVSRLGPGAYEPYQVEEIGAADEKDPRRRAVKLGTGGWVGGCRLAGAGRQAGGEQPAASSRQPAAAAYGTDTHGVPITS